MRMGRHLARGRFAATLSTAVAGTVGAALLAALGPAAAAETGSVSTQTTAPTYAWDPGTLGDAVPGSFVAATFNVLGASHTAGSDPRPSGTVRMAWTVQLLQDNGVDLVGLQELETPQKTAFQNLVGSTYRMYSPNGDPRDSIAWRRSRFALVSTDGVRVPYKLHERTMPIVTLRDRVTGRKIIVLSVHNVAGTTSTFVNRREISVRRELAKVAALRTSTGLPVMWLGDFNDYRQSFYCRMLTNELTSSSVWWTTPTCELPRRAGIDWIFGNPGIRFTGYVKQDGGLVDQASDHPLVLARVLR
jgi:endonuclease/exonuclease/phosphatase family metal-dependent hydrolase